MVLVTCLAIAPLFSAAHRERGSTALPRYRESADVFPGRTRRRHSLPVAVSTLQLFRTVSGRTRPLRKDSSNRNTSLCSPSSPLQERSLRGKQSHDPLQGLLRWRTPLRLETFQHIGII